MMSRFSAAFALITLAASPIGFAATAGGPPVPNEGQASPAAHVKDAPAAGVSDKTWDSEKRRAVHRAQRVVEVRRGGKLIRFSNWDALDFGKTVTVGTRVVVK